MIHTAQASGARSVQDDARVAGYLASNVSYQRTWTAEQMSKLSADQWQALLTTLDHTAALEQSSQMLLELTDLFCLLRGATSAGRSRRWLYTRGMQSRGLRNYEAWSAFVKENPTSNLKGNILDVDPKTLANTSYQLLLDLNPGQTKLQQTISTANPADV